jgi:hypothetical protein
MEEPKDLSGCEDCPVAHLPAIFEQLADLLSVAAVEDPEIRRRNCLSIGDEDGGVLLLASLAGRFDRVADLSLQRTDKSPWLQLDHFQSAAPTVVARSIAGDVFDDRSLDKVLLLNEGVRFEFCFMHMTLHHLRLNRCGLAGIKGHACGGEDCVGVFDPEVVFSRLFKFARTVVVSEAHYLGEDGDKDSARGGMLSLHEIEDAVTWLSGNGRLRMFSPKALVVPPITSHKTFKSTVGRYLERTEYFLVSATDREERSRRRRGGA